VKPVLVRGWDKGKTFRLRIWGHLLGLGIGVQVGVVLWVNYLWYLFVTIYRPPKKSKMASFYFFFLTSISLVTPLRDIYLSLNDSLLTWNTLEINKAEGNR